MSRASAVARRDILEAPASPHALLPFLTITHRNLAEPIRVVSDALAYVWGGETYHGVPFDVRLLPDGEGVPESVLVMQNVDRRIGAAIRGVSERARVTLSLLTSADFDLGADPRVEVGTAQAIYGFAAFELVDVSVTPADIQGRLILRDYGQEPFGTFATEVVAPGLWR
jgi:hypothetical protein